MRKLRNRRNNSRNQRELLVQTLKFTNNYYHKAYIGMAGRCDHENHGQIQP